MNRLDRRGFTLAELLIAMVVTSLVGLALSRMLTSSQRLATSQVEQASLQGNLRQGSMVVATELQEIGADTAGGNDIIAMTDSSITYRALGNLYLACAVALTEIRVLTTPSYGSTGVVAGRDSLLLFVDNNPNSVTDDRWVRLGVTSVTNGSTCGTQPAIAIGTTISLAAVPALSQIVLNAPLRAFTPMEFGVVSSGSRRYLGLRGLLPAGAALQPLAGPVIGQGLRLGYADSVGATTTNPARVRTITMTIYGQTDRVVRLAPGASTVARDVDSLVTLISLRNTPRP
jgi:prepilin-type N-terminal cleavage/methylation domain-containing protein